MTNGYKVNTMSRVVINLMTKMTDNEMILRLLYNNIDTPMNTPITPEIKKNIMNPNSAHCKIYPFPFSLDAAVEDASFLRVYYNDGSFDKGEIILESDIIIDIVVAKSLWLIHNGTDESMIRPYEIMARVIDQMGRRSPAERQIDVKGFQHLYVNSKFDCIRLYCKDWTLETQRTDERPR